MNKLIIAEKPMLARDIARVMCGKSGKLPLRGNGYTVVACAGHLLELADPKELRIEWGKWNLSDLPIVIKPWPKKISRGKNGLVKVIQKELKNCDSVINAGDPDDEGQLIVDEILDFLKFNGYVERVYINDSIDKNIKKAFMNLKNNNICRKYGNGALARQIADYIFGINESRLAGLRLNERVSIGRVQTPTLGLIVNRDRAIKNHKTTKYYELNAKYSTQGKQFDFKFIPSNKLLNNDKYILDKNKLNKISLNLPYQFNGKVTCTNKHIAAPLPYNLTKLQSAMSKEYGYSAKKTLQITQELRDKYKAITYNRTDCQYLPNEIHKTSKQIIDCVLNNLSEKGNFDINFNNYHKAFNDNNISAHHAIIPQESNFDISKMSKEELNVYKEICYSFIKLFMKDQVVKVCECIQPICDGKLKLKIENTIKKGWNIEKSEQNQKEMLEPGNYLFIRTCNEIIEKETKPPKHYTEGTLIADMASIAKYCTDPKIRKILKKKDEDKKGENGGIGTTATRADIIERLKNKKFIELKGKRIVSTEFGRKFYDIIPNDIKSADVTAKWWLIQEDIINNNKSPYILSDSVINIFKSHKDSAYKGKSLQTRNSNNQIVGICPICGKDIILKGKIATCQSNKSKLINNKWEQVEGCGFKCFTEICKKKLSITQIQQLLTGMTIDINNLESKSGKSFSAKVKIKSYKGANGFAEIEFLFKN